MNILSPSILSANFANLENDIIKTISAGAKYLHIDIMDGHFVPNISIGPVVLASVRKCTNAILDVHLMIENPLKYIAEFINAGADIITIHAETVCNLPEIIRKIKDNGIKASVSIKPNTPIETILEYLPMLDMVLIMTVEPGFGGQSFILPMREKIRALRKYITDNNLNVDIEVDGGIKDTNVQDVISDGANVIVCGSYIFSGDIAKNTTKILEIMNN